MLPLTSSSALRPSAPFAARPAHWVSPHGFAWYAQPAAVITQSRSARGTLEAAISAMRVIDAALSLCAEEVAAAKGLIIIHDWRHTTSWDADARRHMMQRVRGDSLRNIRRVVVVMSVNPIVGAALQTACMLYSLTGRPMQVAADVTPVLLEHGITMPGRLPAKLAAVPS